MTTTIKLYNQESEVQTITIGKGVVKFDTVHKADVGEVLRIEVEGDLANLTSEASVIISGNVSGDVQASGSVHCGNVAGHVKAGGPVHCQNVKGNLTAGGPIIKK